MADRYGEIPGFEPENLGEPRLEYAVRELYTSPEESRKDYMPIDGSIPYGVEVGIKSKMNEPGKLIVDGRESKSFEFPRGTEAKIKVAESPLDIIN